MNSIATVENDQLQNMELITIDPEKYVAAIFEPFHKSLQAAIEAARPEWETIDENMPAGIAIATKWRAVFRDEIRIASEKVRKARKEPIITIGKLIDAGYKEISEKAAEYEDRFDRIIKDAEARKEAEKKAKIEIERQRVVAIMARIDVIRNAPLQAMGKSSSVIQQAIAKIDQMTIGGDFAGYEDIASTTKESALVGLRDALQVAITAEAEAERMKVMAEQLEKQSADQEAQRKALADEKAAQDMALRNQRIAAEKQAAEDAAARAAEDRRAQLAREAEDRKAAKKRAADQKMLDEQVAIIRAQQDAIEAEARAKRKVEQDKNDAAEAEARRIENEKRAEEELAAEVARKAKRDADEAAAIADKKVRDAAPALLAAVEMALEFLRSVYIEDAGKVQDELCHAIRLATE